MSEPALELKEAQRQRLDLARKVQRVRGYQRHGHHVSSYTRVVKVGDVVVVPGRGGGATGTVSATNVGPGGKFVRVKLRGGNVVVAAEREVIPATGIPQKKGETMITPPDYPGTSSRRKLSDADTGGLYRPDLVDSPGMTRLSKLQNALQMAQGQLNRSKKAKARYERYGTDRIRSVRAGALKPEGAMALVNSDIEGYTREVADLKAAIKAEKQAQKTADIKSKMAQVPPITTPNLAQTTKPLSKLRAGDRFKVNGKEYIRNRGSSRGQIMATGASPGTDNFNWFPKDMPVEVTDTSGGMSEARIKRDGEPTPKQQNRGGFSKGDTVTVTHSDGYTRAGEITGFTRDGTQAYVRTGRRAEKFAIGDIRAGDHTKVTTKPRVSSSGALHGVPSSGSITNITPDERMKEIERKLRQSDTPTPDPWVARMVDEWIGMHPESRTMSAEQIAEQIHPLDRWAYGDMGHEEAQAAQNADFEEVLRAVKRATLSDADTGGGDVTRGTKVTVNGVDGEGEITGFTRDGQNVYVRHGDRAGKYPLSDVTAGGQPIEGRISAARAGGGVAAPRAPLPPVPVKPRRALARDVPGQITPVTQEEVDAAEEELARQKQNLNNAAQRFRQTGSPEDRNAREEAQAAIDQLQADIAEMYDRLRRQQTRAPLRTTKRTEGELTLRSMEASLKDKKALRDQAARAGDIGAARQYQNEIDDIEAQIEAAKPERERLRRSQQRRQERLRRRMQ